ncbi:alpha/beta fold hydrolase [Mycobacterium sp. B14F4]|uniref:alpha/beta fold hydrolase n=1 Tax=Mycobacterium sp. B14F4 TaxID=3153565 RepID=UPI00325DA33C
MRTVTAGTGSPPLFFVHGFACNATDWQAQIDTLKTRTTVVACDLPGHGSRPGTPAECTIEAYGKAVTGALAGLKLPPTVLVGHSMGCRVVLEAQPFAARRSVRAGTRGRQSYRRG